MTDDAEGASREWRQADRFRLLQIALIGADGQPEVVDTPDGVALVSQTCDAVLTHRPYVQVAPIVTLSGNAARAARDGKQSQYAHLPDLGDDKFADLDRVSTVSKTALLDLRTGAGVAGDAAIRRFAGAIARRFGRFAFPDEVSDAMKALRDLVQSKASKPTSPFGQVLKHVAELRAESRDWSHPAPEITLSFVVKPGALPTLPDDDPGAMPASVRKYQPDEGSAQAKLTAIAEALTGPEAWSSQERHWLWTMLADAAALHCNGRATAAPEATRPTFFGEVVSADSFSLTRSRRSEIVDLDHLSAPFPLESS